MSHQRRQRAFPIPIQRELAPGGHMFHFDSAGKNRLAVAALVHVGLANGGAGRVVGFALEGDGFLLPLIGLGVRYAAVLHGVSVAAYVAVQLVSHYLVAPTGEVGLV